MLAEPRRDTPPEKVDSADRHKMPVFCIVDPSLKDFIGHHFAYDEAVARGAIAAGYRAVTLAHHDVTDAIADSIEIHRCFRRDMWGGHPLAAYVPSRFRAAFDVVMTNREFLIDLRAGLKKLSMPAGSVLFAHMIFRNQLNAFADFVADQPVNGELDVVLLLRYPPAFYDNPLSARAFRKLERAAATGRRVRLASDSARLARDFNALTSLRIEVLPIPHTVTEHAAHGRSGSSTIRLVSLGNARDEKGFVEILDAIRLLEAGNELHGLEFKLQANDAAADVQSAIDDFAASCPPQVTLLRNALPPEEYTETLLEADVVLVPYWRDVYRSRTSGVFLEAVAAGKIVIATSDTWMSDELQQYGGGILIDDRDPKAIVEAIRTIRLRREVFGAKADSGRAAALARHNPASLIAQIKNGPTYAPVVSDLTPRVALFYPWGNFLERQSGASIRCNLLAEKLAERADVRVIQDGAGNWRRPDPLRLVGLVLAAPLIILMAFLASASQGKRPRSPQVEPKANAIHPRITVESVSPRIRQHIARRLLRLVTPKAGGQESMLWYFIDRSLDPNFKRYAADVVRWADVVVVEYPFWASIIVPLCRSAGKRVIVSSHDVLSQQSTGVQILDRLVTRFEIEGMARGDVAVTVSESDREWYRARGVESVVVPNPVDHARLAGAIGVEPRALLQGLFGLRLPHGPFCLFVGSRYQPNIEAANHLRQIARDCPSAHFMVVGDCADAGQTGNYTALGRVDGIVLALLYQAAAMVVVPLTSGTGSSVKSVEAMGAGKAVLGTGIAFRGLEQISASSFIQEDDFRRWPLLITELLGDTQRLSAIGEAAQQAARNYDYRRIFETYVTLLGLENAPVQAEDRSVRHSTKRQLLGILLDRQRTDLIDALWGDGGKAAGELISGLSPAMLNAVFAAIPLQRAVRFADVMMSTEHPLVEEMLRHTVLRAYESGEFELAEAFVMRLEAIATKDPGRARRRAFGVALQQDDFGAIREIIATSDPMESRRQAIASIDLAAPDASVRLDKACALFYGAINRAMEIAEANNDAAAMADALEQLLRLAPTRVSNYGPFRDTMWKALRWFYSDRNRPASNLLPAVVDAIRRWSSVEQPVLDVLCDLGDFNFFAAWNFEASSVRQCELALPGMVALGEGMARTLPRTALQALPARPPAKGEQIHVAYLAMFADPADPMTVALQHIATALLQLPEQFRVTVYAWNAVSEAFLDRLRAAGARCHVVAHSRPTVVVNMIEALASADPPAIVISDMNNAIPTAVFARRLAPVQIFMQCGMPAWSVPNLDAVFNSFGFDPAVAGWRRAEALTFEAPWDLAHLNPVEVPEEVLAERAGLDPGLRWIGNYGRLVKVTEPCLRAVERILQACPGVGFITGGSGDGAAIRDFMSRSPVGQRMIVAERFVPGHSWGRFLEIFLDTWPLTGGESCREIIAKGRPVVALHSAEMPALSLQRDPALLADDWDGYVERVIKLLNDPHSYAEACDRARALATRMADYSGFVSTLADQLHSLLDRSHRSDG